MISRNTFRDNSINEFLEQKHSSMLYSKDKNYVYVNNDIIIFADPNTFEIIEYPYSKDKKRIFNGNLPMEVNNIKEFEVTKRGSLTESSVKSFFIEWNKDFQWLDTICVNGIIVSTDAEARTRIEKFQGFRKVE